MLKMVKCVNNEGRKYLTLGKSYEVTAIADDENYIIVDDRGRSVATFKNRFTDIVAVAAVVASASNKVVCIDASGRKGLTVGKSYDLVGLQPDGDFIIIDDKGKTIKTYAKRFKVAAAPIVSGFKVGDAVVCIDNSGRKYLSKGKTYTVTALQADGDVIVTDDKGKARKTFAKRFALATTTTASSFKVGDTVTCIDSSGRKYLTKGKSYTISALQADGDVVITDDKGKSRKTFANRFAVADTTATAPLTVSVGDYVECINADGRKNLTLGDVYEVVGIQADGDLIVTDDSGKDVKVLASRFALTNDDDDTDDTSDDDDDSYDDFSDDDSCDCDCDDCKETPTVASAFKVGDSIACIDNSGRKYLTKGKIYTVTGIQTDGDVVITDDKGKSRKTYAKRFALEALPATVDNDIVTVNITGTSSAVIAFLKNLLK